jgi:N-formylglutamate deformylase
MLFRHQPGDSPLLINVPHAGVDVPPAIHGRFTDAARELIDTDWHVHRLVDFAPGLGVSLLQATHSRYVIDLNRGADDQPLYAGPTTGLVPVETFDGDPLYMGDAPGAEEVQERIEHYWRPYHQQLRNALDTIRQRHGFAVLLDAHSIRSQVPRLFDGRLPDLNLGTFDGRSCSAGLEQGVIDLLAGQDGFSHVVNGRFKGGYNTRHYGQPDQGIHALQIEIAQACYMDESSPRDFDEDRAAALKGFLRALVEYFAGWRP